MTLSDGTIKEYLDSGKIVIDPIEANQIQPASVDLTLDSNFLIVDDLSKELISMNDEIKYRKLETGSIVIPPKSFILVASELTVGIWSDDKGQ